MKNLFIALSAASVAVASAVAPASAQEQFLYVVTSSDQTVDYYLDTESILILGSGLIEYTQVLDAARTEGWRGASTIVGNCSTGVLQLQGFTDFDLNGRVIRSSTVPSAAVIPEFGTTSYAMLASACNAAYQ